MDPCTQHALKQNAGRLRAFARNGRWGTCVDCPRDSEQNVYPEFCINTERYDHHLGMKDLAESWEDSTQSWQRLHRGNTSKSHQTAA